MFVSPGMAPASSSSLKIYLLFFVFFISDTHSITNDERQILLRFKYALQKSSTDIFRSWTPENSVCNFTGVTCNNGGFVTEIELSSQNLIGSPRLDSICNLRSLEKLSLGGNNLQGTIPGELNNCKNLHYLDLSSNVFNGTFPNISSLRELRYLLLNSTGISGSFPWQSLSNLSNLIHLSLGDNPFVRSSFPVQIFSLYNINWLYLANCSLEGEIPEGFGNLTKLGDLELSGNYLTGEIPNDIVNCVGLWQLELYSNFFTGSLPSGLGNLTNLEYFDVSENNLDGSISEVRFLKNIVSLQLFMNGFVGEVPEELGEFRRLVNLSIYRNKLTGPLPQKLGSWAEFNFIDASENFLTGSIPPDMCKKKKMMKLLLLQNRFTGGIPETYGDCTTLIRFRVNNNSLTGVVPDGIWSLPNAALIDLRMNQLEGSIPPGIAKAKSLAQLYAGSNKLTGVIPPEISKAASLVSVILNDNQISGEIPSSIGQLVHLGSLQLQNNNISGTLSESIGSCRSLADINLANNLISGEIPTLIGRISTLNSLNLSKNKLTGQIPDSLSSLGLSLLDLSYNNLVGPIPPSLAIAAYNGSFDGNLGLCSESIESFNRCSESRASKSYRVMIGCLAAASAVLMALLACFICGKKEDDLSLKGESWNLKSFQVLSFTEDEIIESIKQENQIGKGGSGNVYRVTLANGKDLAVKHIWNSDSGGRTRSRSSAPILSKQVEKKNEFDAEVKSLSSIRHVNVVKLYCSITSEDSSLLVYEYMPNGSLWDRLHTCHKVELDWESRYEIALGSGKGLEYLHHGCERPIIHRDVKSSNILLDEFLKPRIADFGLSKIVQAQSGKDSTHVIAGTPGYFAPEYGYTCRITEKSDVYSFGVVLMELVTGKRPIEAEFGESVEIVRWVCSKLKFGESLMCVVDASIDDGMKEEAVKVLKVALLCTARLPDQRPTMRAVVKMLEAAEPSRLLGIVVRKDDGNKVVSCGDKF